jgi:hypothetical protein
VENCLGKRAVLLWTSKDASVFIDFQIIARGIICCFDSNDDTVRCTCCLSDTGRGDFVMLHLLASETY